MKEDAVKKFLDLIGSGHDPEAAAVGAGLPLSTLKQKGLQRQIQEALRIGTARLRSKITSLALEAGDARTLENVLTHRVSQIDETEITVIERVIVRQGTCDHCGHPFMGPTSEPLRSERKRLSDPPARPPAIPMDDTQDSPSTDQTTGRRAALMELVHGGNTVVEIPSTDQRRTYGASEPYPFHPTPHNDNRGTP